MCLFDLFYTKTLNVYPLLQSQAHLFVYNMTNEIDCEMVRICGCLHVIVKSSNISDLIHNVQVMWGLYPSVTITQLNYCITVQ